MVFTFGEIMLRISPSTISQKLIQTNSYEIIPGGSESNVAIALSNLGIKSGFITSLPDNPLAKKVLRQLKSEGVNTNYIRFTNDRIGLYWTDNGTGPRNSFVIYDRENSAFSKSTYCDYNWSEILKMTDWFHFSGISPAVGENITKLLEKVIENIKCPYSVDLNFRENLWQWIEKDPRKIKGTMNHLCDKASLITGNESDFQNIFGFTINEKNANNSYSIIARKCFKLFPNLKYVAISNRISYSANNNDWDGFLFVKDDEKFCYEGIRYNLDNIQDRVGTGDSFSAGIIYGLHHMESMDWQQIIDFAITLGALNHTTKGDSSNFTSEEVWQVLKSGGSGRIIR